MADIAKKIKVSVVSMGKGKKEVEVLEGTTVEKVLEPAGLKDVQGAITANATITVNPKVKNG